MRVVNPATADVIAQLEADTATSVGDAYARARGIQRDWAASPIADRVETMRRFREAVLSQRDRLAGILTSETGKPIRQARNELKGVIPRVDFFIDNVEAVLATRTVLDDADRHMREQIAYEPLGVVANVSAWNYPWFVGSNVFVPALLTGNTVLYKPSELASLTGVAIAELLHESGVPGDVFQVLVGAAQVGGSLVDQPVDGIFFTGSYSTGRRIAEAVATRMIPVQLELGGKDPVYVCDDVDVAAAAAAVADGAFYNGGQSCCSVERAYVHDSIHDEFVSELVGAVRAMPFGDPTDETTYIGPLTRSQQLDVLTAQVEDALGRGASLLVGGHRLDDRPGNWFEPTVLSEVRNDMAVMRDESFGPIIGIQRVRDDNEAVTSMNDTEYGLTAGVFSSDEARARRILDRLDTGSVYWNCCDRVSPRLPWSGRGRSGIGSTLSTLGILAFVKPRAWHLHG